MKVAIQGCLHGELDRVYEILQLAEERTNIKIDLLICCGDFQAARDCGDLNCMAVPPKYRHMQSFYKYYSGQKKAPMLTIFIGGNHEASNHLWELSYGGWVAPNMYYLGNAGVVRYGGLRIAGISGIYNDKHFRINHFEAPPYNPGSLRSAYHVRSCDVFRLKQLSGNFDIMLSHDWPASIYHHGDKFLLIRLKPYFEEEILCNTLGSPAAMDLLQLHKPTYWFSGHLHVKFAAVYYHLQAPPPHQPAHYRGHAPPLMSLPSKEPPRQEEAPKEGEGVTGEEGAASQQSGDVPAQGGEGDKGVAEDSAMVVQDASGGVADEGAASTENAAAESEDVTTEEKPPVEGAESADATAEGVAGDATTGMVIESGGVATGEESGGMATGEEEEEERPPIKFTKFLALDKPLPKKRFLQILDVSPSEPCDMEQPYRLEYDREWLAILKSTEPLMKYTQSAWLPPHPKTDTRLDFTPTAEELDDIDRRFQVEGFGSRLVIPENFVATIPAFVDGSKTDFNAAPIIKENPQTVEFCEKLGIENPFKPKEPTEAPPADPTPNPDEIDVDDEAGEGDTSTAKAAPEPEGYKGQLGEGLLEWQVDTQTTTTSNQPPTTTKLPLNLPPPTLTTSPDQSEPMPQSHEAGEEVESKTGIKRALSLSPNAVSHDTSIGSGDPVVEGDSSKSESKGPELKRRNVALYASEETEEA